MPTRIKLREGSYIEIGGVPLLCQYVDPSSKSAFLLLADLDDCGLYETEEELRRYQAGVRRRIASDARKAHNDRKSN